MTDDDRLLAIPGVRRLAMEHDEAVALFVPAEDVPEPELSIVIPALNEGLVIAEFLDWCREGIAKAGVAAEILIVDSSSDRTPEIVLEKGGRVLRVPKRGLGRAYIDAIPAIRGRYVLLGDADCTYDFRNLAPFLARLREGAEYVMGSRFTGSIEPGAMPALHRYFGTPLTNAILNLVYGTRFSDIHCGMRALTLDAFRRLGLVSQSWEYASEMIIKAVRLGLRTAEVPVGFLKDREGRTSHHRRLGWFSPWHAGWINLRTMLVHGADFFALKPGVALLLTGLAVVLPLAGGPVRLGGVLLSLNSMLFGGALALVGLQGVFLGCMAQSLYDPSGVALARWTRFFAYTPMALGAGAVFLAGLLLDICFVRDYVAAGYRVTPDLVAANHGAVLGLLAMLMALVTFVSTLLLHALAAYAGRGRAP